MSPICPECEAPFKGRPTDTRAGRVCVACGHAFLLSPDGSTESLKKRKKPEPEPEPEPTDSEGGDELASTEQSDATTTPDAEAGQDDAAIDPTDPPAPEGAAIEGDAPPADAQGGEALPPAGPDATAGTPENSEGPTPASNSLDAQGWSVPSPVSEAPPTPAPEETEPAPRKSGAPTALLAGVFVLGAGLGFAAQFIPGIAPEPPPPPPPPAVEAPAPEPVPLPPQVRFVRDAAPLWAGPLSSGAYAQVAVLPTGSAVLATTAEAGSFLLVHDAMGRAGFISAAALVDERPDAPFSDCARAPFEDEDTCNARAAKQRDACESASSDQSHTDQCKESFAQCAPGCAQVGGQATATDARPGAKKKKRARGKRRERRKGKAKATDDDDDDYFMPMPEPE